MRAEVPKPNSLVSPDSILALNILLYPLQDPMKRCIYKSVIIDMMKLLYAGLFITRLVLIDSSS